MRTKLKALYAEYHVYFQYVEVITVSIIHKILIKIKLDSHACIYMALRN